MYVYTLILCPLVSCLCVHLCEGARLLELELEAACGCWELNSGNPEEEVLLTAKAISLAPLLAF